MLSEGAGVAVVIATITKLLLVGPSVIRVRPSVIRASVKIASYVADASHGCANETKKPGN